MTWHNMMAPFGGGMCCSRGAEQDARFNYLHVEEEASAAGRGSDHKGFLRTREWAGGKTTRFWCDNDRVAVFGWFADFFGIRIKQLLAVYS